MSEVEKLDEGVYAIVRGRKGSLYIRDERLDYGERKRFSYLFVRGTGSVDKTIKLPIPWESVLEDTEYTPEDAKSSQTKSLDKAKIMWALVQHDGFGRLSSAVTMKQKHKAALRKEGIDI